MYRVELEQLSCIMQRDQPSRPDQPIPRLSVHAKSVVRMVAVDKDEIDGRPIVVREKPARFGAGHP